MDRNAFGRLCLLLENVGGLVHIRNVQISEQFAIFLSVLAHHKKDRSLEFTFLRPGHTISINSNRVLDAVLRLHTILAVEPTPVDESCTDETWRWFKGCLGALDGTYILVRVPLTKQPRYRTRKGGVVVNVLGVSDRNMKFTYVLSGWEGSVRQLIVESYVTLSAGRMGLECIVVKSSYHVHW
ncbi:hypothetical protein PHJA_002472500 [Phtheirospermum japonicum]|uniref:DUF8040 domain-containing protein n=1 Tax=Phtheirospermum japonicum TaxID=374723 RepID=A0A830CVR0_9LAMI|nr:hypothetical protein PHJA_002472500 [Phtheirospermum japonicum]